MITSDSEDDLPVLKPRTVEAALMFHNEEEMRLDLESNSQSRSSSTNVLKVKKHFYKYEGVARFQVFLLELGEESPDLSLRKTKQETILLIVY